jgi:hypothetical protein
MPVQSRKLADCQAVTAELPSTPPKPTPQGSTAAGDPAAFGWFGRQKCKAVVTDLTCHVCPSG